MKKSRIRDSVNVADREGRRQHSPLEGVVSKYGPLLQKFSSTHRRLACCKMTSPGVRDGAGFGPHLYAAASQRRDF